MLQRFVLQNLENCSEHPYIDFCWRGSPGLSCRDRLHAEVRRGLPPLECMLRERKEGGFPFSSQAKRISSMQSHPTSVTPYVAACFRLLKVPALMFGWREYTLPHRSLGYFYVKRCMHLKSQQRTFKLRKCYFVT